MRLRFPPLFIHCFKDRKHKLKKTLILIITLATLLAVSFYTLKPIVFRMYCGAYCFRVLQPEPYRKAYYFSHAFVDDSFEFPAPQFTANHELINPDYKSKLINSLNGHRLTTYQPSNYNRSIYIFGGSTLANVEVPDSETIPSLLQLKIKNQGIRVENLGYAGAQIKHQLLKLKAVKHKAGDLVIFYDGINEAVAQMLLRNDMNPVSDEKTEIQLINLFQGWKRKYIEFLQKLRSKTHSIHFFNFWFGMDPIFLLQGILPTHLQTQNEIISSQQRLEKSLLHDLVEVQKYCDANNLVFIHIFQPILTPSKNNTNFEYRLLNKPAIIPKSFNVAFQYAIPVLKEINVKLKNEKIQSVDLTNFLDKRKTDDEIFLDYGHLNHIGNRLVADKIFDILINSNYYLSQKTYSDIFNSLENVLTDHEKANKIVFNQFYPELCKEFGKYLNLSKFTELELITADTKICENQIQKLKNLSNDYCEHDQAYWKRALIRWMVDQTCRRVKQ